MSTPRFCSTIGRWRGARGDCESPLLRAQPGGLEGLFWLVEPLESHCLAVADAPDGAVPVIDLDAASGSVSAHCRYHDDAVAHIDEPLDLHPEISDCVVEVLDDGGEGVDALSSSRFKGIAWVDPLDIGVQQVRLRRGRPRRPTRVDAPHDLHVLLRHRLLRKPGRFEGLRPVDVAHAFNAPTAFEREEMRNRHVHLDPAGPADRAGMEECDDAVAYVEEVLGLVSEGRPLLGERSQVLADAGVTPNWLASERGQVRMPLDLRVTFPDDGLYVSAVASVVQPPSRFHVLLRHHPPSIPPADRYTALEVTQLGVEVRCGRVSPGIGHWSRSSAQWVAQWKNRTMAVNRYEGQVVRIALFAGDNGLIRGRTFERCDIKGPAVIVPLGTTV